MVELKRGLGKDGFGSYVEQFPTRYFWVDRVKRVAQRVANKDGFRGKVWVNTYIKHPPAFPRPKLSMDVWGFGGRGDHLPPDLGDQVRHYLFKDPDPPDIWWQIYKGRTFVRDPSTFAAWFEPAQSGPAGSDAQHNHHIHTTYLAAPAQRRFREWLNRPGLTASDRRIHIPESVEEVLELV